MTRPFPTTRVRIVEAAERLMAERGIDTVSLREIARESGARNVLAVQYHFVDRSGVVGAIIEKHAPPVEARRHALLDEYEADDREDLRGLAAALVRPLAYKLSEPDGGPEYLQILADLVNRPRPDIGRAPFEDPANSLHRWRKMVDPFLEEDAVRLHRRFTTYLHTTVELGRRARSGPHADDRLFVSYLVDVVAALLASPVSDETRRLVGQRTVKARSTQDPQRGKRAR
jgi:AcrR family transcriptional regulator